MQWDQEKLWKKKIDKLNCNKPEVFVVTEFNLF